MEAIAAIFGGAMCAYGTVALNMPQTPARSPRTHWLSFCPTCVHIFEGYEPICKAFPGGIPERFVGGAGEHRTPVEGDGGIVYAPREQVGS